MPIPTRTSRELASVTDAKAKTSNARAHQRTGSTALPATVNPIAKTHQRSVSSIPQHTKVGYTEPSAPSLQRAPSTTAKPSTLAATPRLAGLPVSKPGSTSLTSTNSARSKAIAATKKSIVKPHPNTHQQHSGPKKAVQPVSTLSDTSSVSGISTSVHDDPDDLRLRDELLQLQLMQVGSQNVLSQFESTSKTRLKSKFDTVKRRVDSILALEREREQCINYAALQNWIDLNSGSTGNKLQLLGTCIRDLDCLITKNGKLSHVLARFDTWFEDTILALDSRKKSSWSPSESLLFVTPTDDPWMQDVFAVQRKLRRSKDVLQNLSDADERTEAIYVVLAKYRRLADNLLEELESCISIHTIILEQECAWIATSSKELMDGQFPGSPKQVIAARKGAWEGQNADRC